MPGKPWPIASVVVSVAVLALGLTAEVAAQDTASRFRIRPSVGVEYFTRTISWDDASRTSKLESTLGILRGDLRISDDFRAGLFAGYALSNFNGLVFRGLPFSMDYEAGAIGSICLGGDAELNLFAIGNYRLGAIAQFVQVFGRGANFDIPSLNQPGTAEAKGTWQRIVTGPVVRFMGYDKFAPYLAVTFNRLAGTFVMAETIQELVGTEEKAIKGKSSIGITLGTAFDPSALFHLTAEVSALPYKKLTGGLDVDYGAAVRAAITF